jgi:hypothetical protein
VIFLIAVAATLLLIRPLVLMPEVPSWTPAVIVYVMVTMYLGPVAAFVVAFVLFAGPLHKKQDSKSAITSRNTAIALFCAVLGVAVHNLFDFAIFEPGVLTAFWIVIACLISIDSQTKSRPLLVFKPAPFVKVLAVTSVLAAGWAYLSYVFVPVAATTFLIRQANAAISTGRLEPAHKLLEKAAGDDALSASALSLNSRLYLQEYEASPVRDRDLLLRAESCLKRAIERDNVPFKNFERLTDTYRKLAETSTGQAKADWLGKALEAAAQAVKRYPGCGRLYFKQAQIADQMGKTEIAIENYRKAIEIEDEYRRQFKQIYPQQEDIVSRLDSNMYLYSKERVEELSGKSDN